MPSSTLPMLLEPASDDHAAPELHSDEPHQGSANPAASNSLQACIQQPVSYPGMLQPDEYNEEDLDAFIACAEDGLKDALDEAAEADLDSGDDCSDLLDKQERHKRHKKQKAAKGSQPAKKSKKRPRPTFDDDVRSSEKMNGECSQRPKYAAAGGGRGAQDETLTAVVIAHPGGGTTGAIERPHRKRAGQIDRMNI